MQRGLILFAVVNVILVLLLGAAVVALESTMKQFVGLIMLPLAVVPLVMAYLSHSFTGATGNPFRGLIWGQTWWYFAGWGLGLLGSLIVLALALGLGLATLDLAMGDFMQVAMDAATKNGQQLPPEAMKWISITGYVTAVVTPTIGAWIAGAIGCLSTFPWLGWFGRRLLVNGRTSTAIILAVLFGFTGAVGGVISNPNDAAWSELSTGVRIAITAFSGLAVVPLMLWLFYRTKSAVLPALVQASYQSCLGLSVFFFSERNALLAPPQGLLAGLGALLFGLALWLWKDPGGMDLAVAAVAYDGTPLTPEQVKALAEQDAPTAQMPPAPPQ